MHTFFSLNRVRMGFIVACVLGVCLFEQAPAQAATKTVCTSGCDYSTISSALISSASGDTVVLHASSTGVGEALPLTVPTGVTLSCANPNVVINFDGHSDFESTIGLRSTSTIEHCTFGHVILQLGWADQPEYTHQTILGNTFSRSVTSSITAAYVGTSDHVTISENTDIQELRLSSGVDSADISSNTFYYHSAAVQYGVLVVGSPSSPLSNLTFSYNTVAIYSTTSVYAGDAVVSFGAETVDIVGNMFRHMQAWSSINGAVDLSISGAQTASIVSNTFITPTFTQASTLFMALQMMVGDVGATIERNTFFLNDGSGSGLAGIKIQDIGNAGGSYTMNIDTNHNLFYYGGALSSDVFGMIFQMNQGTYTLNLADGYEGFYGFQSDRRLFTGGVTASLGTPLYTSNPYMQTQDADSTNDYLLAPFSPWRGVGPSVEAPENIGADTAARRQTIHIDDDGIVDYSSVDATSTSVITDAARNDDTFSLAQGIYDPFTLTSSTQRGARITIDGAGAGTIIQMASTSTDAAIALYGMSTTTISDLTVQNASSARFSTHYYASLINYSFGGTDYTEGDGDTIVPNSTYVLGGSTCEGIVSYTSDASSVSVFDGLSDIHVALGQAADQHITLLVPNVVAANQGAVEANECLVDFGWTTDAFISNVFVHHGENQAYTYDASQVTNAGATLVEGRSAPSIAKSMNPQIGLLVSGGEGNTVTNVTSTNNYYGAYASSTDGWTIAESVFAANTYDVRKTGGAASTAVRVSNSLFDPTHVLVDDGRIPVWMRARFFITNESAVPISGVSVSSTSESLPLYGVTSLTTDGTGYTAYSAAQPAGYMLPNDTDFTAGGDNQFASPYRATTTETEAYQATSTVYALTSRNQTVTLVMQDSTSAPVAPSNAMVTSTTSTVSLWWTDASSRETGFVIAYGLGASPSSWTSSTIPVANTTNTQITGLLPNTLYSFKVAAYNTYGTSSYSNAVATTTLANPPLSPTVIPGQTTISLLINPGTDNPTSTEYVIYQQSPAPGHAFLGNGSSQEGDAPYWLAYASWNAPVILSGFTCNTGYSFLVGSRNADGIYFNDSRNVVQVSVTTTACSVAPSSQGGGGGGGGGLSANTAFIPFLNVSPTSTRRTPNQTLVANVFLLGLKAHMLIKLPDDENPETQEDTAVYYIGVDGKRHAFPHGRIYASWYPNFDGVVIVSKEVLAKIPLGENVHYRPGTRLVKFMTDPKVYAVGKEGVLHWVTSELTARALFGDDWNKKIDDISDAFFGDYQFGSVVAISADYESTKTYAAQNLTISQELGY